MEAEDRSVLRAVGLCKSYGRRAVVRDASFEVRRGEVVGLLGPNGAGKTTSFYMVVGLVRPDAGNILLGDHDLTREPMYRRSRLGIGYLPQEASVFRSLSVEANILAILELQGLRLSNVANARMVRTVSTACVARTSQRAPLNGRGGKIVITAPPVEWHSRRPRSPALPGRPPVPAGWPPGS